MRKNAKTMVFTGCSLCFTYLQLHANSILPIVWYFYSYGKTKWYDREWDLCSFTLIFSWF